MPRPIPMKNLGLHLMGGVALMALAACNDVPDYDLRGMGTGFTTAGAMPSTNNRPAPDANGVISYPTYQVAVARAGDTVATIAGRLSLDAGQLASYNGLQTGTSLRAGEVLALPARVSGGLSGGMTDITSIAGAAIDRAGDVTTTALAPSGSSAATAPAASSTPLQISEPVRHQVARGETAYIIARRYNIPVRSLAEWNGLDSNMTIREGQYLMIPTANGTPSTTPVTSAPGQGSATPVPPSASQPLPSEATPPAAAAPAAAAAAAAATPNLGAQQTSASQSTSTLQRPVAGNIIRAYARGRNDGIDIGAPAGTDVQAAAAGTVAAITTNTDGIQIVVIRHDGNLMTVYTHLDRLTVARGASVSRGQVIGKVADGATPYLHFEVRRGLDSVDPSTMLP